MKRTALVLAVVLFTASALAMTGGTALAQDPVVSVVALDEDTFVSVQKAGAGEMVFLYEVRGEKVYLVDVVFNGTSRDVDLPRRYTHHVEVENR